jgi:N-acetylmuramoyl-L-alanine amidase
MKPGSIRALGGGTKIVAEAAILHVRSGPGTQYSVTGSVFRGTAMQLIRVSPHWAAVILPGGTTGWVARSYTNLATRVKKDAAAGRQASTKKPATRPAWFLRVDVSVVNIHNAPGTKHRVIARALRNTRLQILSFSTHWAHVALPASNIEGWVLRSLIH